MNYSSIVFSIISIVISILVICISFMQARISKRIASPVPLLKLENPKSNLDGSCYYELINVGPGHARNIKIYIEDKNKKCYNLNGPLVIPYENGFSKKEYKYTGDLVIYNNCCIKIKYENMTGYKVCLSWRLKNGEFQIENNM